MNSKGTIGTGLTWMVATIIIVFILVFHFVAMTAIFFDKGLDKPSLKIARGENLDSGDTRNLVIYLQENNEIISNWADDNFILSKEMFLNGERDEKAEAICNTLNEKFDFSKNSIYLESGEESIIVQDSGKGLVCNPGLNPIGFDQSSKVNSKLSFISDSGNKVEVIYYDR